MQKWSSKLESTRKLSKTGPIENFLLWSKSTVNNLVKGNGQRLTWQCDVTLGLTWQYMKQSRCVAYVGERGIGA